jgi:hypothetical protein
VRISARRLLDVASYGLRLSPPPRREPVSHLRVATERYRAAASRQHLDAVLARYRQKWIMEPETLDRDEKYALVLYAKAAVRELLEAHPERQFDSAPLRTSISLLEDYFVADTTREDVDFWNDTWERFREELLGVLPDLDDPAILKPDDTHSDVPEAGPADFPADTGLGTPPGLASDDQFDVPFEHEEKGFRR